VPFGIPMRGQASLFVGRHYIGDTHRGRVIWQGASPSPILFGLIMHSILTTVCEAITLALAWAGEQSPVVAAAWVDDVILIADSPSKLETAAEVLRETCAAYGLHCEWEADKTAVIGTPDVAKPGTIVALPGDVYCAWMPYLILLGTAISFRDPSGAAVHHRVCQAWRAWQLRRKLLMHNHMALRSRLSMLQITVCMTLRYGLQNFDALASHWTMIRTAQAKMVGWMGNNLRNRKSHGPASTSAEGSQFSRGALAGTSRVGTDWSCTTISGGWGTPVASSRQDPATRLLCPAFCGDRTCSSAPRGSLDHLWCWDTPAEAGIIIGAKKTG